MNNLLVKRIKETQTTDTENNSTNQIELTFRTEEKTATITLEGKGSLKVLTTV